MPAHDKVVQVVREWTDKADNDLKTASHTLKLGKKCPTDTVGFHAPQCIEKYLKALLVWQNVDFPKTHSLKKLIALLPTSVRPLFTPEEEDRFAEYAVDARYPGWGEISITEARGAVAIARRVRKEIRTRLPKEVLHGRKR